MILPRRAARQPVPHLNPPGDCGPCCLAGLLDLTVEETYRRYLRARYRSTTYNDVRQALLDALADCLLDRVVHEPPSWPAHAWRMAFGHPAGDQAIPWFAHYRMAADAGYYGLAMVDSTGQGGRGRGAPDHWVMLVGARERYVRTDDGTNSVWRQEVLVSCSAVNTPDEEWVEAGEFLRNRGGFNLLLARPWER